MRHPFLIGLKLYVRGVELSDVDGPYLAWLNDRETTRFLDTGRFPTTRETLENLIRTSTGKTESLWLAIVDRKTDKHIGNIKLGPIHWIHRSASIGIVIGDPRYRGRGYGREAIELVLRHAFTQLNVHKVTAGAYGDHTACLALFKQLGFSVEGSLRQHLYREGRYYDKIVMGLQREVYVQQHARSISTMRNLVKRHNHTRRRPLKRISG